MTQDIDGIRNSGAAKKGRIKDAQVKCKLVERQKNRRFIEDLENLIKAVS